ncbi:dynein regulatory complex subunit 3 [Lucilia cuprina]|uniref:dynein regulatory complex subunit 3 n=1 Tax=Lucilia cuprina TaxID=7375 RepID=UPI001F070458|nr:dynein regulatory complex subunit 3 [Lucilia cuprina]XP_046810042.1 dynein regulatory complex subunit 3 [Lucilia cuprina]XP_046810046.1 dynein regulatory complex subunit 3 [Lucilia cuprina]
MAQATMDNNKKIDNLKSLEEIIYPEIEPGIISKHMIEKSYLEDCYKGEEARLHQMEPVIYERITALRLDFRNILRIDHLWILPNLTKLALNCNKIEVIENIEMLVNLKELDLSFNYIERIENLDKLVNLEVLSLFSNMITKLENLDTLEKLIILSIGNNLINSTEGIERLRFLKNLKVLNLEGNPLCNNPEFCLVDYIAAVLPHVKYYEYVAIKNEDRQRAKERYYRELREIKANEEIELQTRAQKAKEEQDAERLSSSFVEHLNEHQLYESLWKGDDDGRILMMVGSPADDLAEEYDKDIFELTQEIYKLGLQKFEERQKEFEEFTSSMEEGHLEVQQMGHKILEEFQQYKENIFEEAIACHKYLESRAIRGEEEETEESLEYSDKLDRIAVQFDDMVNKVWQQLMSQELHLHETTEETIVIFQRRLQEMIAKFVEQAQTYFGQLRDIALHFAENLGEIVNRYIATKLALQDFEGVPEPLRNCMEDREAIANLIAGMKDYHTQRIDEREDRLMTRSKSFIDNMIDKLNKDELERNRAKVLEINTYLDLMTENLQSLQHEVREGLLNEEG